jgi:hypothetical protein
VQGESVTYHEKDEAGADTATHALTAIVQRLLAEEYEADDGRLFGRAAQVQVQASDVTWTPGTRDAMTFDGVVWTILSREPLVASWIFNCVRDEITHRRAGDFRRFRRGARGSQ